jgi:hypothetical protein
MPVKSVFPTFGEISFSCPICGALASQKWFELGCVLVEKPSVARLTRIEEIENDRTFAPDMDSEDKRILFSKWRRLANGEVFLEELGDWKSFNKCLNNVHLSMCYSCKEVSIWKYDALLYPLEKFDVEPNADLGADIKRDFNEARQVLDLSPRSAAALLRLCIQKLLKQLGCTGKDINSDIGAMVKKGLDPKIQKALDVVRVVGNNAVHPGTMDIDDNREIAARLFQLVNRIAYDMITHPNELDVLYASLPEVTRESIAKRDAIKP